MLYLTNDILDFEMDEDGEIDWVYHDSYKRYYRIQR